MVMTEENFRKALEIAIRLLTRRDHSVYELEEKLKLRGISADVIHRVVAECSRWNYLDDDRTARLCIRELHRKGFGVRRIRAVLHAKRLEGFRTEALLEDLLAGGRENENARRMARKKLRLLARETDRRRRRQKLYRYLLSRGFPDAVIADVLREEFG
jgi:regulatory protein